MKHYYLEPFKTRLPGFNTEFSVHELKMKIKNEQELDFYEQQFVDYLKETGNWGKDYER